MPSPLTLDAMRQDALAIALRHAPHDGLHDGPVPGMQLIRASQPGQALPAVYEPGLVLVLQGRKQATLGHEVLHYDPLHCLLVAMTLLPLGQIVEASPEQPYLCVRLHQTPTELASLMLEAEAMAPAADARAPHGRATVPPAASALNVAPVSADLLDATVRMLRLLDAPQDIGVLAPLVRREVFYRVLTGPLGARLRSLAQADSQARRIARAIDLLRARFDQPLRIEELADVAHMSATTLHLHFKQMTAMSPLQYQKHLRLHQARRLMLAEDLDAASAALRVGYESPSQFSREYRRLFGTSPRADVAQIQAGHAAPGAAQPASTAASA